MTAQSEPSWERYATTLRGSAVAICLMVLGACASPPPVATTERHAEPVKRGSQVLTDASARTDARGVLSVGFATVREKYIEEIPLATLTLESLRGLGAIDPAISAILDGERVILKRHGREIVAYPFPAENKPQSWGRVAADLAFDAMAYSDELRRADPEDVYQAMFDGVLAELDIYSRYAGAVEADRNRASRDGFGGVGIRFRIDDHGAEITDVLAESPADMAGLKAGDRIVAVDTQPVVDLDQSGMLEALRGPIRSKVKLTVERIDGDVMAFSLRRAHIVPPTVEATVEGDVLRLRVRSFNQGTAGGLTRALIETPALEKGQVNGIVLDLRGNPGGLLKQSVEVADVFLSAGKILDTLGRHPDSVQHYEAAGRDLARGLPVVVLIDGRSASAAEIVAAALQDGHRAVIVGTSSYGKGTVQTVVRLPNDGEITLTWSRFMAPSGYALHGLGVFPMLCTSQATEINLDTLRRLLAAQPETVRTLDQWRRTGLDRADVRRELRAKCPPQRRLQDVDLKVAKLLLKDDDLYGRALQIAANPNQTALAPPKP